MGVRPPGPCTKGLDCRVWGTIDGSRADATQTAAGCNGGSRVATWPGPTWSAAMPGAAAAAPCRAPPGARGCRQRHSSCSVSRRSPADGAARLGARAASRSPCTTAHGPTGTNRWTQAFGIGSEQRLFPAHEQISGRGGFQISLSLLQIFAWYQTFGSEDTRIRYQP